ncbi:MAG: hypothetical protein DRI26_09100 [Chloroflexi bacterium]|nr:MAG: hypothetical protein DRI26_09100 [Chloroflexota bacterium]
MRPSAQRLTRRGIATLTFDFRGHGRSEGFLDANIAKDVTAALRFLRGHPKIDPERIAIVGHSMGAMAAIHAASELENIQALVFISSPADIDVRMGEFLAPLYQRVTEARSLIVEFPRFGPLPLLSWFHGMVSRLWMWIRGYRMRIRLVQNPESWVSLNPLAAIHKIGASPKLFIHCAGDKQVPYEGTLKLYEKARWPKEILIAKGGFHALPLFPGKLREKWISWLVSVLTQAKGGSTRAGREIQTEE